MKNQRIVKWKITKFSKRSTYTLLSIAIGNPCVTRYTQSTVYIYIFYIIIDTVLIIINKPDSTGE